MPLRLLCGALSPAGLRGGLSILIFHRVRPQADAVWSGGPSAARFDQLLSWVSALFNVLPLDEAIDMLQAGRLPARAMAITFDDGYADNCNIALPLLQRHRMNATFFVASDFIDGGRMWNDSIVEFVRRAVGSELDLAALGLGCHSLAGDAARRATISRLLREVKYLTPEQRSNVVQQLEARAAAAGTRLPSDLMMTTDQLRALRRAGMLIGGHTRHHPILAKLDDAGAREEICGGKQRLEAMLGEPVKLFAYPNGRPGQDYVARDAALVRAAGYRAAVTTAPGMARQGADVFQLPRFTPWDSSPWRFGLRLAGNMRSPGAVASA